MIDTPNIDEELKKGFQMCEEYGFPPTYDGIRMLREHLEKEVEKDITPTA